MTDIQNPIEISDSGKKQENNENTENDELTTKQKK